MILVDTSVIVPFLRTADLKLDRLFRSLPVAICGMTRAEILHGVRSPADHARTLLILNGFAPVATGEPIWDSVGDILRTLRAKGIQIPISDAVIATVAMVNDIELWTRDAHFNLVQREFPVLKLFAEPS